MQLIENHFNVAIDDRPPPANGIRAAAPNVSLLATEPAHATAQGVRIVESFYDVDDSHRRRGMKVSLYPVASTPPKRAVPKGCGRGPRRAVPKGRGPKSVLLRDWFARAV